MEMVTSIGGYYLRQPVAKAPDLTEFDPVESVVFEAGGWKPIFKDSKVYKGHDVSFLGSVWKAVVGATSGIIYEVAIQHMSADKNESDLLFRKTLDYLRGEMGRHSEHPFFSEKYVWAFADGNVLLNRRRKLALHATNLILTGGLGVADRRA